jgi:hypothetical protein
MYIIAAQESRGGRNGRWPHLTRPEGTIARREGGTAAVGYRYHTTVIVKKIQEKPEPEGSDSKQGGRKRH